MTNAASIKATVGKLIEDIAPEVNLDELDSTEDFRDELDLDSMDFMRLLEAIDKTLGVSIPESDYDQVNTLNSMVEYISKYS